MQRGLDETYGVKYLLVLTDPGLDDALALTWLSMQRGINISAIIPVAGNVDLPQSEKNVCWILKRLDIGEIPVVSSREIAQNHINEPQIHGSDGLGGLPAMVETPVYPGIEHLEKMLPERIEVLCLGPLTVLAEIMPCLSERASVITIMGGTGLARGNLGFRGEFNFGLDPVSARKICVSNNRIRVISLDATRGYGCDNEVVQKAMGETNSLFGTIMKKYVELGILRGADAVYPHDLTAATSMLHSDLFSWEKGSLNDDTGALEFSENGRLDIACGIATSKEVFEETIFDEQRR